EAPYGDELRAHVAEPLGGGARRGASLKLAALLHDVSKPETRRRMGGRVRFFEHDVIGARRARAIGERLRLPERMIAVVTGASPLVTWRRAGVVRELLGGWREQRAAETRPALVRGEDVMARFSLE